MVATQQGRIGGVRTTSIRVGVIGVGFGAAVHVPALQHLPETEVVAVCARRAERAHLAAAQHGVKNALSDFRVMLRDPGIDAVVVATPPRRATWSNSPTATAWSRWSTTSFVSRPIAPVPRS